MLPHDFLLTAEHVPYVSHWTVVEWRHVQVTYKFDQLIVTYLRPQEACRNGYAYNLRGK